MLRNTLIFQIWMVRWMSDYQKSKAAGKRACVIGSVPFGIIEEMNYSLLEELCKEEDKKILNDLEKGGDRNV